MEQQVGHFGFIDFMDESNFQQFIELIRGETSDPIVKFCPNYDCEHVAGCLDDIQFGLPPPPPPPPPPLPADLIMFDSNNVEATVSAEPISIFDSVLGGENSKELLGDQEDDDDDGDESSGTTTTTKKTTKPDRSRTLISERRRRGRMKEKLYALRSLVPNITKMDKASIVGDAVLYVQELQMQAKKLKAEIADLESSSSSSSQTKVDMLCQNGLVQAAIAQPTNLSTLRKKIAKMNVFRVEEREFYVRIESKNGRGVAVSLYKAVESLTSFNVQSSNVATFADNFILTFTLSAVRKSDQMEIINLPNLKFWITGALLNQGFEFTDSAST